MELSKNELITKLEKIYSQYKDTVAIKLEMDEFTPKDNYIRKIIIPEFPGDFKYESDRETLLNCCNHSASNAPDIVKESHRQLFAPDKEPEKPILKELDHAVLDKLHKELQDKMTNYNSSSLLIAAFTVCFFLCYLIYHIIGCAILTLAGIIAFFFFRYKIKASKVEEEKKKNEALIILKHENASLMAEYEKEKAVYEQECQEYEKVLEKFMDEYMDWRKIYIQSANEEAQIAKMLEAERIEGVEKINKERYISAQTVLNECNDLIPEEYLPKLPEIISILKNPEVDSLNKAISLCEVL